MSRCPTCCNKSTHPDWYYCALATACNSCFHPVSLNPPSPTPVWPPPQVITPVGPGPKPRPQADEDPEIVAAFRTLADDYTSQNALDLAKLLGSRNDYTGALTVAELTATSFEDDNWFQEQIGMLKQDVRIASVRVPGLLSSDIQSILVNFKSSQQISPGDILPYLDQVPGVVDPTVTAGMIADGFNNTMHFGDVP